MMELEKGDILVFEDQAKGLYGKLKKWLLGTTQGHTWGHASIYIGNGEQIESIGRGVCQTKIQPGRLTAVFRWYAYNSGVGSLLIEKAKEIRDKGTSWYDYPGIVLWVVPSLFIKRLTGNRVNLSWHRDSKYWCSEFTEEVYYRSNLPIWGNIGIIALPDDYFYTGKLKLIGFTRFNE
jgi:hypothetical protein